MQVTKSDEKRKEPKGTSGFNMPQLENLQGILNFLLSILHEIVYSTIQHLVLQGFCVLLKPKITGTSRQENTHSI